MRQIAREKKKNKLFKTDLGVSKRSLKGQEPKGKRGDKLLFFKSLRLPFKKRAQVVVFSPRACIMEASAQAASKTENRGARGRALPPQKKTENGENCPPSRRKNEEARRSGKEARPSEQAMRERRQSGAWRAGGWTGELCVRPLSRSRESGRD